MEGPDRKTIEVEPDSQQIEGSQYYGARDSQMQKGNADSSQTLFHDSPVYEPDDDAGATGPKKQVLVPRSPFALGLTVTEPSSSQMKRKLSDDSVDNAAKIQKFDAFQDEFGGDSASTKALDDEVSQINSLRKKMYSETPSTSGKMYSETPSTSGKMYSETPSTSGKTVFRSSPAKVNRSNSVEILNKRPLHTPEARPSSAEIELWPRKFKRTDVNPPPKAITVLEEPDADSNDTEDYHLYLSPTPELDIEEEPKDDKYSSEPVTVKDREETIDPGKVQQSRSEGYNYSDQSTNLSQPKDLKGTTDQDSTDSIGSFSAENVDSPSELAPSFAARLLSNTKPVSKPLMEITKNQSSKDNVGASSVNSPNHMPSMTSKLASKLSNGNSSTPTETVDKMGEGDATPDMVKLNAMKGKQGKNESFRASNNTTPSTISPLQNGHSLPLNTPQNPVFDVHVSHNEDCEFLSLVVVRTDNDTGMDIFREYQRVSKRFTMDPYMADVSSVSPGSVTSGGIMQLPGRTSFVSTVSSTSTSSSNRTSDGNFVVPQPPRKSISNPTVSVKGYDMLLKKLQEVIMHIKEAAMDDPNKSLNEEKVSVAVQTSLSDGSSLSNGNASPEEVSRCDKATPKSSLKKTRVRGRRPMAGKTKRAILPTQHEEPEYIEVLNSPEMVPMPTNGGSAKSPRIENDEKPLLPLVTSAASPKPISKLKQRKPLTPVRPATPVEKPTVKIDYPGYPPDTVVLAKWVDRRYYSGRIVEVVDVNRYLIRFDDGQTKTLIDEFIIFGDFKRLPLQGQSVYALVDEEQNYEPGLVLEIEENSSGVVTYRCTTDGDTIVLVTASELYLTEDQAMSLKETRGCFPSAPTTPRRRGNLEVDLDNIVHGPRSARSRDKGYSSARKRFDSPRSPKASTSGLKTKSETATSSRKRLGSESSEMSESSNSALPARLEEVAGVEPEVQRTPRKIDGVKAGPLQLKGAAKQNVGKKNSKLTKFENDEDTVSTLGPIPTDAKIFAKYHFLLTCTEPPRQSQAEKGHDTRHYSSEEDGETTSGPAGTDTEDLEFSARPFNKERLREQLEAGGGVVYSHFDDVPKNKYSVCKLVAPRPCLTAKFIQCLAADIRAVSHAWVIESCARKSALDVDAFALPAGWSIHRQCFVNWVPPSGVRNTTFFKNKLILLCGDQDTFVKFWERVCSLAGANTRVVHEDDLKMDGAPLALVTEWDCPHEVQNKANQESIPLVSTTWVVQCLIEAQCVSPTGNDKFSFMYTEPE